MGKSKQQKKKKESGQLERAVATTLQETWRSKLFPHCRDDADLCTQRMLDAGLGDLQKLQTCSGDEIREALDHPGTSSLRDIGCTVVLEVCEKLREQPALQVYFTTESSKPTCESTAEVKESTASTVKDKKPPGENLQTVPVKKTKPAPKALLGARECDLWDRAVQKAKQEMKEEFQYEQLCKQGRQLYQYVLTDKTKRLYEKLKARRKFKSKRVEISETHPGSEGIYIDPLD